MKRSPEWLLEFAAKEFGIDLGVLTEAAEQADASGESFCVYATHRGIFDSVQSSILHTLSNPESVLEDYHFMDMLGRGAMGVVYRARQKSLNREVAIKTMIPGALTASERFKTEAQTIAKLRHPNIVTAFEYFEMDHRFFLVLEYLEGVTLAERLKADGPMSELLTWNIILQVAAGLLYAKEHNIVHRDIKPQNLFLLDCPPGFNLPDHVPYLKLTDFGLAASIDRTQDTNLTLEGKVVGTPVYMSPEQASDSHVDHRADIYSLGATAFHMLAGKPLFDGDSLMRLLMQKQNTSPPRLDQIHDGVSIESGVLIQEMMQINPLDRPGDYAQIISRIQGIIRNESPSAAQVTSSSLVTPHDQQRPSRLSTSGRRWIWIGTAIACLLVAAIALVTALRPPTTFATPMSYTQQAVPLFEPPGVRGWTSTGGSLNATSDSEGSGVLEVFRSCQRKLPDYAHFSFSAGVNLLSAEDADFYFEDDAGNDVIMLKLSRTSIGVHVSGTTVASVTFPKDPWRTSTIEEPLYRELRVDTEPGRWIFTFDGNPVAEIPPPGRKTRIAQLRIESDERFHLESVSMAEKAPRTP